LAFIAIQEEWSIEGTEVTFQSCDPLGSDTFAVAGDNVVLMLWNNSDTDKNAWLMGQAASSAGPVQPDFWLLIPARRTVKTSMIPASRFGFRLWAVATVTYDYAADLSIAVIRQCAISI